MRVLTGVVVAVTCLATAGVTSPATADEGRTGQRATAARATPTAVVRINVRALGGRVSPLLGGSNHRFPRNGYGIWDPDTRTPDPTAVAHAREAGISLLRYPGGSQANLFDWKQAIGEPDERGCQVAGKWGRPPLRADYGVDEHMLTAGLIGADTHITVPFATESPRDAAAWVEYMNARVGQDPDGDGVDMARLRVQNQRRLGQPTTAYDVDEWTIGNEPYLKHERFWMSESSDRALQQYISGGRESYADQLVGSRCRRTPDASSGSGRVGQRFEVLYPPVLADSQRITVAGERWREVGDLQSAEPGSHVYTFDDDSGHIHFGGGVDSSGAALGGAAPARNAPVRATYTGVHRGYVHFARAMHKVDPSINVCSEWGQVNFVRAMQDQNRAYDCVASHPYTFMGQVWKTPREGHDTNMLGLIKSAAKLSRMLSSVRMATSGRSHVVVTEYGALATVAQPNVPLWEASMTDALYQMSSLSTIMNSAVAFAEGGALTSRGLRAWISGRPDFVISAAGRALQATRTMISGGGRVVGFSTDSPRQQVAGGGGSYATLGTSVTRDATGALNLLLINRDPDDAMKVDVRNPYFTGSARAKTWRVTSRSISSANTAENPNAVQLTQGIQQLPSVRRFSIGLPAHSILRLRLPSRR